VSVTRPTSDDPPHARAVVDCVDWEYWDHDERPDAPVSRYLVGVTGRTGLVLRELVARHGAVQVVFSGRQTIRHLDDGTLSFEVEAEHLAVSPDDEGVFPHTDGS